MTVSGGKDAGVVLIATFLYHIKSPEGIAGNSEARGTEASDRFCNDILYDSLGLTDILPKSLLSDFVG
jgi:hypothetical protein